MGYGMYDNGVELAFVSPAEAHALVKGNQAIVFDAREEEEHERSRIAGSISLPSAWVYFKKEKITREMIDMCRAAAAAGKKIVTVSDVGMDGNAQGNRNTNSRCLLVGQYLQEVSGVEVESFVRVKGGLNGWKSLGFDGIVGDLRCFFANAPVWLRDDGSFAPAEGAEAHGGDSTEAVPRCTAPTIYRLLRGEVFKKARTDAEKIVQIRRPINSLVNSTGQVWTGPNGGIWAELDPRENEKPGWLYVEGPGFGPSTRHINTKYLIA